MVVQRMEKNQNSDAIASLRQKREVAEAQLEKLEDKVADAAAAAQVDLTEKKRAPTPPTNHSPAVSLVISFIPD